MNHFISSCFGLLVAFQVIAASPAADDKLPPNLVKVSKDTNPKCIDYVSYKGEMYCSLVPIDATPADLNDLSQEKQKIQFDTRPWKAAWAKQTPIISSIEYIPVGESINDWHELITSQFITGLGQVSLQQFHQLLLNDLNKQGITYTTHILDEQPNELLFEFQVSQPVNLRQDELQKIVKGKEGFYILHYVIKKQDMGEEARKQWVNNLTKSTLKK